MLPLTKNDNTEKADDENHTEDNTDGKKDVTVFFTKIIEDLEHCFSDIKRQDC